MSHDDTLVAHRGERRRRERGGLRILIRHVRLPEKALAVEHPDADAVGVMLGTGHP